MNVRRMSLVWSIESLCNKSNSNRKTVGIEREAMCIGGYKSLGSLRIQGYLSNHEG